MRLIRHKKIHVLARKSIEINNRSDPNKERSDAKNLRKLISVVLRLFGI